MTPVCRRTMDEVGETWAKRERERRIRRESETKNNTIRQKEKLTQGAAVKKHGALVPFVQLADQAH